MVIDQMISQRVVIKYRVNVFLTNYPLARSCGLTAIQRSDKSTEFVSYICLVTKTK